MDSSWSAMHILLHMRPSPKNERRIRLLIKRGVNLQARDYSGYNVLHFSVSQSRVELTEMFLEKGAAGLINVVDKCHGTPLLLAVESKESYKLTLLLIKYGADVFTKDCLDQNALHRLSLAREEHCTDLAKLFLEKGVSLNDRDRRDQFEPLHLVASRGRTKLVELYLEHGANVNARAKNDVFPLYLASGHENPEVLQALLKGGADIDLKTTNGRTALHEACHNLRADNIKTLLLAGADILVEDSDGNTPFALMNCDSVENASVRLMLRLLALKKTIYAQPSIELKDETIIERSPKLRDFYRDCFEQIERMKSRKFIGTCTFFELLTKHHCQIAALMRNPEFETNFMDYDLTEFSVYAEDLVRAFERAQKHYHSMLEQEDVIDEAVYNILPYIVVRKMAHYAFQSLGECEMRNYY